MITALQIASRSGATANQVQHLIAKGVIVPVKAAPRRGIPALFNESDVEVARVYAQAMKSDRGHRWAAVMRSLGGSQKHEIQAYTVFHIRKTDGISICDGVPAPPPPQPITTESIAAENFCGQYGGSIGLHHYIENPSGHARQLSLCAACVELADRYIRTTEDA